MGVGGDKIERWAGRPGFAPAALAAAWLTLGALAGLTEAILAPPGRRLTAFLSLFLTGALWIPLSLGAGVLARRAPWPGRIRPRWILLHLAAAVAASFLLNLAWFALHATVGALPWSEVGAAAGAGGIRWLHLNAPAFLGCVAFTHAVARVSGAAPKHLVASSGRGGVRIPLPEIDWIEADGDYARVHVGGRDYLLSERLKALAERLEPHRFVRVHRSAIVNVARVRELRHRSHGDYEALLADGTSVRVSRGRREALLAVFAQERDPA